MSGEAIDTRTRSIRRGRSYGASGEETASIGRLMLTERWHPSALKLTDRWSPHAKAKAAQAE
jgi:hypothetical protein